MDFFDNINLDALQPLQDIFPDGWFDDVRQLYGESLSDEMISQSVEETNIVLNIFFTKHIPQSINTLRKYRQ